MAAPARIQGRQSKDTVFLSPKFNVASRRFRRYQGSEAEAVLRSCGPAVVRGRPHYQRAAAAPGSLRSYMAMPLEVLSMIPGGVTQNRLQPHVLYKH